MIASEKEIKIEKEKARELRKTRWWQQKIQTEACYYCGVKGSDIEMTMDHVVPLSHGGKSTRGNVVVCCKDCNNQKKGQLLLDWDGYK